MKRVTVTAAVLIAALTTGCDEPPKPAADQSQDLQVALDSARSELQTSIARQEQLQTQLQSERAQSKEAIGKAQALGETLAKERADRRAKAEAQEMLDRFTGMSQKDIDSFNEVRTASLEQPPLANDHTLHEPEVARQSRQGELKNALDRLFFSIAARPLLFAGPLVLFVGFGVVWIKRQRRRRDEAIVTTIHFELVELGLNPKTLLKAPSFERFLS